MINIFSLLCLLSCLAHAFDQLFQMGNKLCLKKIPLLILIVNFNFMSAWFLQLLKFEIDFQSTRTLVCWLEALVSNPSCTELIILISLSISSLIFTLLSLYLWQWSCSIFILPTHNSFERFFIVWFDLCQLSCLWSPRLLNMSKKFWVSVCLVATLNWEKIVWLLPLIDNNSIIASLTWQK